MTASSPVSPAGVAVTVTVLALGSSVSVVAGFALLLVAARPVSAGAFAASAALLVASLAVEACKRSVDACKRLAWRRDEEPGPRVGLAGVPPFRCERPS